MFVSYCLSLHLLYSQMSLQYLHWPLALVLNGAAAQEDCHDEDDHQEDRHRYTQDDINVPVCRLIPGGFLCDAQTQINKKLFQFALLKLSTLPQLSLTQPFTLIVGANMLVTHY